MIKSTSGTKVVLKCKANKCKKTSTAFVGVTCVIQKDPKMNRPTAVELFLVAIWKKKAEPLENESIFSSLTSTLDIVEDKQLFLCILADSSLFRQWLSDAK